MQPRIYQLLNGLGHAARLNLVVELLNEPLSEDEARARLGRGVQSTVSRHLDRLRALGLVEQDSQRSRRRLTHPVETQTFLLAAAKLAEAVSEGQAAADRDFSARLARARRRRR